MSTGNASNENSELHALIEQQRIASIRPECRDEVSDATCCGILLAHHFRWDGAALLEVAVAALEDANFQGEAARIQTILDEMAVSF